MKLVLSIAAGIILAIVLLTAGCAALVGGAASEASKESGSVTRAVAEATEEVATGSGDGTFIVGEDVQPGTYRLPAPTGDNPMCYWSRLHDLDGGINSIITNGLSEGPQVIHIAASDYAVEFSGCDTSNIVG
jgi:hypothetical protein